MALQVLDGEIRFQDLTPRESARFKDRFLRWAVADSPQRRRAWEAMARVDKGPDHQRLPELAPLLEDRDRYVETLWRRIGSERQHADLRELYEEIGARTPYQRALVDRFVRRFDLAGALRTSEARWGSPWWFAALPAVALLFVASVLVVEPGPSWTFGTGLGGLLLTALLTGYAARGNLGTATQILLPRMAVGITIGYLFLAAAPHLVEVIGDLDGLAPLVLATFLLLATFGYTCFHIWRRVQPNPGAAKLAQRALHVLAIGGAYTALELLLFLPMFSSAAFFGGEVPEFGVSNLLLLATVALALGMVLELAWQERPLTEPL